MRLEPIVSLRPNVKRYEGDLPQLPHERGPDSDTWDNSVAICACMLKENITDVREWLQYHRCDPRVPDMSRFTGLSPCTMAQMHLILFCPKYMLCYKETQW